MQNDGAAARAWREGKGWSRAELSARLSLSPSVIQNMEAGHDLRTGKPVDPAAFARYRLACAALEHGLSGWNWGRG